MYETATSKDNVFHPLHFVLDRSRLSLLLIFVPYSCNVLKQQHVVWNTHTHTKINNNNKTPKPEVF